MKLIPIALKAGAAGGAGILGGKLMSKLGGGNASGGTTLSQDAAAQTDTLNAGQKMLPQGQGLVGMGAAGYQPVLNYWSRILSGNRGDATAALAPEISRIGEGYQAATNASAALNPRGGPSAEFNAELPFQQQHDVTTLLQQARPQAASGLLSGASQATSAGSQLFNSATNAIVSSTSAGRDILAKQAADKAREAENSKAIGKGLFDLIQRYGPDITKLLTKGGSKSPSGGGTTPTTAHEAGN